MKTQEMILEENIILGPSYVKGTLSSQYTKVVQKKKKKAKNYTGVFLSFFHFSSFQFKKKTLLLK